MVAVNLATALAAIDEPRSRGLKTVGCPFPLRALVSGAPCRRIRAKVVDPAAAPAAAADKELCTAHEI